MLYFSAFKQQSILKYTSPLKECKSTSTVDESPSKRKARQKNLFESFGNKLKNPENGSALATPNMSATESESRKRNSSGFHSNGDFDEDDLEEFMNDIDFDDIREPAEKKVKM